ncbi:alaserpin-like isoform X2 [Bradysia coprophila]|uniref:alaserpin-like isoform X2 n=1 Tax=Bradysia coprophila TaxID=38358 RepID=UPI00187DD916|nr:alaserpin-like isoform X2 [Bradysia coprophila]
MWNKMNTVTFGLSICLFGNFLFTMATPPDLTRSISEFSSDLYGAVTEGKTSNVIISPFSVHMAVSLALMGAKGKTSDEMLRGLKLSGTNAEISEEIHRLIEPIQNNSMLKVANKVYVMENYRIKPEFNAIAKEKFHSESESLNFAKAAESAGTINKWVEDKTNDKIKDLIPSDALGADTRMVLVNAIYFKGFWQHQFKKERTEKAPFFTSETDSVLVDMMHVKEHFRYGEFSDLDAKGIELPYKDSDMSLFVILPNKRTGLAQLETRLKDINIKDLSGKMYRSEVEVSLPKFKIEFEVSLVDALKKLGMTDMFSQSADFSGLLETTEPLYVSDVVHKAFIDVNEEGAEAAAATAGIMRRKRMLTTLFEVEHPFMYFIVSQSQSVIVFHGSHRKFNNDDISMEIQYRDEL